MIFRDKTYCASPTCENKCGRKMSDEEVVELKRLVRMARYKPQPAGQMVWPGPVSYGYFCDEDGEVYDNE